MIHPSITPVILSGGSGTRLWPLSRESFPKQYLSLISEDNKSMFQLTQQRISNLKGLKNPILICNEAHRFIVAEQMREIGIKPQSILLEPFGRGTAAAITLAALKALELEDDPLLLVLSADHYIKNSNDFIDVIERSINSVLNNKLVTYGIKPNNPSTGFGYIKFKKNKDDNDLEGSPIENFLEKPDLEKAKKMIMESNYLWNSGIFFFKAKIILKEIRRFHPEIFNKCNLSIKKSQIDLDFQRIDIESFMECPNIPIDIAVMEKTNLGYVFPLKVGWKDLGSWDSVWEVSNKDKDGNSKKGNIFSSKTKNCYLRSEDRLIVALGIEDLAIIETRDALLVAKKSYSQEIKHIVGKLKKEKISEGISHKRIYRPWGFFETLIEENLWKVKFIKVNAGASLSLQMHKCRSEHWIVVNGKAKVQVGDKIIYLGPNQNVSIPLGSLHRLSNETNEDLKIIEVQTGSYLGEDDIIRFDDNYGR